MCAAVKPGRHKKTTKNAVFCVVVCQPCSSSIHFSSLPLSRKKVNFRHCILHLLNKALDRVKRTLFAGFYFVGSMELLLFLFLARIKIFDSAQHAEKRREKERETKREKEKEFSFTYDERYVCLSKALNCHLHNNPSDTHLAIQYFSKPHSVHKEIKAVFRNHIPNQSINEDKRPGPNTLCL
eukprot:Lithocolla_globosa_v1_NODE_1524_length_2514_cov_7.238308.p2 type:complete len:182 gc:universal NODE_1524_length_2514_cov_7.238308:2031-1486(-)